mgnify:CR=1 FL=1|jgi:hypothetical protein
MAAHAAARAAVAAFEAVAGPERARPELALQNVPDARFQLLWTMLEQAADWARRAGENLGQAQAAQRLAGALLARGDPAGAGPHLARALRLFEAEEARVAAWDAARVQLADGFESVFKGLVLALAPARPGAAFAAADMAKSRALGSLMAGAGALDEAADGASGAEPEPGDWHERFERCAAARRAARAR